MNRRTAPLTSNYERDTILKPAAPHKIKIIRSRGFFHRAKPIITSAEKQGVFCLPCSTTGRSMNS